MFNINKDRTSSLPDCISATCDIAMDGGSVIVCASKFFEVDIALGVRFCYVAI